MQQTRSFHDVFLSLLASSERGVTADSIDAALASTGLKLDEDLRLRSFAEGLTAAREHHTLDLFKASELMARDGGMLAMNALQGNLAIPDFEAFSRTVEQLFQQVADENPVGQTEASHSVNSRLAVFDASYPTPRNADYIPALSIAEDSWGVAICTVHGQRLAFGDSGRRFSIQSCCKPINYCQALESFNLEEDRTGRNVGGDESTANKQKRLRERSECRKINRFNGLLDRPDLYQCGRTLFGNPPEKHQQLADHYFTTIPDRVQAFLSEVERRLHAMGVPVRTRHNEVAPGQYEIAPEFETANVAADHQQLTMKVLRSTAAEFGLACLLHEKPFRGIYGSGKHINWSLATNTGENLLDPTNEPRFNVQFLTFLVSVIRAIDRHADLLRASVAGSGNDHRLGANEAPPAIMSIFLGDMLGDLIDQLCEGGLTTARSGGMMELGARSLPTLPRHSGDRNRTSPFAFTGNKFELRAAGSSSSVSWPCTVLNTMVAESLADMADQIEQAVGANASPIEVRQVVLQILTTIARDHRRIVFNGDNYSQAWHVEAERRGLPNLRSSEEAYHVYKATKARELFSRMGVLSDRELNSRWATYTEQYRTEILIEARTMLAMAEEYIVPGICQSAKRYSETLQAGQVCNTPKGAVEKRVTKIFEMLEQLDHAVDALHQAVDTIELEEGSSIENGLKPHMERVRQLTDQLESICAAEDWKLARCREMLFVR